MRITDILSLLQPLLNALMALGIPKSKQFLYETAGKSVDIAFTSLQKLKDKIKASPNEIDNACFKAGLDFMDGLADSIKQNTDKLRQDML